MSGSSKASLTSGVVRLFMAAAVLITLGVRTIASAGPASAVTTSVVGSAYGYYANIGLFGGTPSKCGIPATTPCPNPAVALPAGGSATPVTATLPSEDLLYGPAHILDSGAISVSTQGVPGPGAVTSSASVGPCTVAIPNGCNVGQVFAGPFTGTSVSSTCSANGTTPTGSATIVGGQLTEEPTTAGPAGPPIAVPTNPTPNYTVTAIFPDTGKTYTYIFNEQIVNPDGSLTVNAAHEFLNAGSAGAQGDLIFGQVICGATAAVVGPLSITTASPLPAATQNATYSDTLAASGGTGPYTWALASGSTLPAGLTISSAGIISGTPTAQGTTAFSVTATDSATPAATATKALSLTVNAAVVPVTITTTSPLTAATQNAAYSATLAATGGTSPYTWALASGSALPLGLTLSPAGAISGTPTGSGPTTFTVTVSDSATPPGTANMTFTLTVNPVLSQVGGSAFGYYASLSLFGGKPSSVGPTPTVSLPAAGSATPVTASAASGSAAFGPATIFTSGPIAISTQGTPSGGTVTSSTQIQAVGTGGSGGFTADQATSTCTANQSGTTGSTTFTNGSLVTSTDANGDPATSVAVPASPPPNYIVLGTINNVGGSFKYVFNEQITNPDGSITVNAGHEYIGGGPNNHGPALGDLIFGQSVCSRSASSSGPSLANTTSGGATAPAAGTSPLADTSGALASTGTDIDLLLWLALLLLAVGCAATRWAGLDRRRRG